MPKRAVMTDKAAPAGGPYSHAVIAGDTIYLAGAIPALPDGTRVTGSFAEQARPSAIWQPSPRRPAPVSTTPSGWASICVTSATSRR
jgi:hypothetical protein